MKKTDFKIIYVTEGCYRIEIRTKFLWFFYLWELIMLQETEHSDEVPMEFKTFKEAESFIDFIIN